MKNNIIERGREIKKGRGGRVEGKEEGRQWSGRQRGGEGKTKRWREGEKRHQISGEKKGESGTGRTN